VRPSAGNFSVSPTGEDYIRARAGVFESVLALGWHRSQWDSRRVLHVSANKMHIAGEYSRRRENGERISSQQVTYIVTRQGERWGIQSRFGTGKVDSGEAAAAAAEPARQAVEAYFEAFNSLDLEIWADTLHFPQVRLSSSGLDYWQTREDFFAGTEPGRQRTWFRTKLESAETVQAGADGVNVIVRYSNLNSEDETLSSYDAVYLVTRHEGRWAVQARSTYGP
ncbi:MAG: hypothetical protein O7C75_21715, partial [Verrucomicrobia bacterium]|nr:hypothetical protein [Verrucomicrobiota bacterium]